MNLFFTRGRAALRAIGARVRILRRGRNSLLTVTKRFSPLCAANGGVGATYVEISCQMPVASRRNKAVDARPALRAEEMLVGCGPVCGRTRNNRPPANGTRQFGDASRKTLVADRDTIFPACSSALQRMRFLNASSEVKHFALASSRPLRPRSQLPSASRVTARQGCRREPHGEQRQCLSVARPMRPYRKQPAASASHSSVPTRIAQNARCWLQCRTLQRVPAHARACDASTLRQ